MIIGVTGTYAAGKDTVAEYLITQGFNHYSLSDEIREILIELGIPETRENLLEVANITRKEKGHDHLAKRVTKKLSRPAVVTSIRNPKELEHLKNQENFTLIHVDANREVRYQRTISRARTGDVMSYEEFVTNEERELSGLKHEQNLIKCFREADHIIYNNGEISELHTEVEKIIKKLKVKGA